MSHERRRQPWTPPKQQQERQPGLEHEMTPQPEATAPWYRGSGKLHDKVAIITGGDSGIGRAVAILFAREGADVVIVYLDEHKDASATRELVEQEGRRALLIAGDVAREAFCQQVVRETIENFGKIDCLVNNAAVQFAQESIADISEAQLDRTFRVNVYAYFFMAKAALPYLSSGSTIINCASVNAFRGHPLMVDYSATKGAEIAFTRSLAPQLVAQGIRVNSVAPGPVWTPLIPATMPAEEVEKFGKQVPMQRPGEPEEIATCFVFLASDDSSYLTGQTLHPNGGEIVNA